MAQKRQFLENIGKRLRMARVHLKYTRNAMAQRLGLHRTSYYKNEYGETTPSLFTLYQLQKEYNISMDWLLFGRGSMIIKNQPATTAPQIPPDIAELFDAMNNDALLKHEIMAFFLKKTEKK